MKLVIPAVDLSDAGILIRNGKGANGMCMEVDVSRADEATAKLRELADYIDAVRPKAPL